MVTLPWTPETAPHCVLEVTRGCNIRCRGCYKLPGEEVRSLDAIARDLDDALERAPIHTVSIAGAEPTLHPRLEEIVREVKRRKIAAALITNGLALDDALLERLARAGLDVVMVHVDEGQRRPDLARGASADEVNALRLRLTERAARHGLDTGLSVTLYPDTLERLPSLVDLIVGSEHIHFLFATSYADVHRLMRRGPAPGRPARAGSAAVKRTLRDARGLEPFASLGGDHWLSYFVPVLRRPEGPRALRLRAGPADALLLRLPRLLCGRHVFYCRSRPLGVGVQLAVNQLARGDVRGCLGWLRDLWAGRAKLDAKRLVFDGGLDMQPDGTVTCYAFCPNRTVKDGALVPVCTGDYREAS